MIVNTTERSKLILISKGELRNERTYNSQKQTEEADV